MGPRRGGDGTAAPARAVGRGSGGAASSPQTIYPKKIIIRLNFNWPRGGRGEIFFRFKFVLFIQIFIGRGRAGGRGAGLSLCPHPLPPSRLLARWLSLALPAPPCPSLPLPPSPSPSFSLSLSPCLPPSLPPPPLPSLALILPRSPSLARFLSIRSSARSHHKEGGGLVNEEELAYVGVYPQPPRLVRHHPQVHLDVPAVLLFILLLLLLLLLSPGPSPPAGSP